MSRTPLTLFEHDTLPYAWTERDLRLLAALNGRTGDNILTPKIDAKGKQLQAAQYVGVVRLGEQIIQILPKIHRSGERDASAREATANLLHMLAYAADVPIDEQGVAPLLAKKSDWFDVRDNITLIYFLIMIVIPLLIVVYLIINGNGKSVFHKASLLIKMVMLTGVGYMIVVNLIINHLK